VRLDESRVHVARDESGVAEDATVERDRRADAFDAVLVERAAHARDRFGAILPPRDSFEIMGS
jgi:hypothetical protein